MEKMWALRSLSMAGTSLPAAYCPKPLHEPWMPPRYLKVYLFSFRTQLSGRSTFSYTKP